LQKKCRGSKQFMKKLIYIFLISVLFTACSSYEKALKSTDLEFKNKTADALIAKKKYSKAISLFDTYLASLRGKPYAEEYFYKYAETLYKNKEYISAANYFESFASQFPKSDKAEMAYYLEGESYSRVSPPYGFDQVDTQRAIDKLQRFADKYQNSEYLPKVNETIKTLSQKLEYKAFEIAKQYNTTGEFTRNYNSAIIALDNFLYNYPGTIYKEDALFYKLDSQYKLATNSVPDKKQERLIQAQNFYNTLLKFSPETKYKKQANNMLEVIEKQLKQYN
jgi:outer membrane protein assembly factor BamD